MELKSIELEFPEGVNVILGQAHFIKTVEDLYEILITSLPSPKFGLAFSEASGDRLVRFDGTDDELTQLAVGNIERIQAGHCFIILLRDAFPINVLNQIKGCQEVCRIFCATANPVEVITVSSELGGGILGVIDGHTPVGVESDAEKEARAEFLRSIGYKK